MLSEIVAKRTKTPVIEAFKADVSKPVVSVCIPTYNHASTISRAIDSALAQETDFNFEILIGEDDSRDNTRKICTTIAAANKDKVTLYLNSRDNNITICEKPSGWHNSLHLLSKAKGEYIAICEGDDEWCNHSKLQLQVSALNSNPSCDLAFHPCNVHRDGDYRSISCQHSNDIRVFSAAKVIAGGGEFCPSASLMFRASAIQKLPTWISDVPALDYFLQVHTSLRGGAIFTPEPMSIYNIYTPGSWSDTMYRDRTMEHKYAVSMIKHLELLDTYTHNNYKFDIIEHQNRLINHMLTKKLRLPLKLALHLLYLSRRSISTLELSALTLKVLRQSVLAVD